MTRKMNYISRASKPSKRHREDREPLLLHRIGFDVDPKVFAELKVIPHGFRTKLLRKLIEAVVKLAERDGNEVYHKVIADEFVLILTQNLEG